MAISSLDTHEIVKDLKAAGFTEEQAEAVTRAVKQARLAFIRYGIRPSPCSKMRGFRRLPLWS